MMMEIVEQKEIRFENIKQDIEKERRKLLFKRIFTNKLAMVGGVILLFVLFLTFFGPFMTPYNQYEMEMADRLQVPSGEHILGTDNFGRDLFTRIVYGAQASMGVGLSVALLTAIFGMIIGLYSAYFKMLDAILMRISDGLMAFPSVLLAIALMAALGANATNVIIALSIVYTPNVARVVRSAALVIREQTYIEAIRSQGASDIRIIWGHIAPNTISPLIVQCTFIFAEAIILEAGLSFLGVGIPAPDASWGNILQDAKSVIYNAWWMTVFPGFMIILSVLGLNLLGDGVRDILDPHANAK